MILRLVCFFALSWSYLHAHDAGLSQAEAHLTAHTLELTVAYDLKDVRRMLPPTTLLGTDSSDLTLINAQAELQRLATLLVETSTAEGSLATTDTVIEFTASDHLGFRFIYPRPTGETVAFRFPNLGSLPARHREYFTFTNERGTVHAEKMLSSRDSEIVVSLLHLAPPVPVVASATPSKAPVPEPAARPGFEGFLLLGVEHIWTGYDHLLFLFGLLLVCASFRSVATIVTCFTVAHSITLALATFNVINLSAALVEPLIAASIVFVGVDNIARRGAASRALPLLTFAFGLIHGFGFASVLRDLGVGAHGGGLVLPLFAFNLGVELGQLAVAAVVLPLVWRLRKNELFLRRGIPVLSALVAAAGLYWLLERTVLG